MKTRDTLAQTIERLRREFGANHSGVDILRRLESTAPLSQADFSVFLQVIAEKRADAELGPLFTAPPRAKDTCTG